MACCIVIYRILEQTLTCSESQDYAVALAVSPIASAYFRKVSTEATTTLASTVSNSARRTRRCARCATAEVSPAGSDGSGEADEQDIRTAPGANIRGRLSVGILGYLIRILFVIADGTFGR